MSLDAGTDFAQFIAQLPNFVRDEMKWGAAVGRGLFDRGLNQSISTRFTDFLAEEARWGQVLSSDLFQLTINFIDNQSS